MWKYSQSTGNLYKDGKPVTKGYSGNGRTLSEGRNNPAMETVVAKGPIPRGMWRIGKPYDSKNVGPFAMPLDPIDHNAHGRTAFRIHGDNKANNASHGCIILPRQVREAIWNSGDRLLEVVK